MIGDYKARIQHLIPSFDRYVNQGVPTGGFLRAVLENNLLEAAGKADAQNIHLLAEIAAYVYNDLPRGCHGSPEKVEEWIEHGGLGLEKGELYED